MIRFRLSNNSNAGPRAGGGVRRTLVRAIALAVLPLALAACSSGGGRSRDVQPTESFLTDRTDIVSRQQYLERQLASNALRGNDRAAAQRELDEVKQRLSTGDLRVGDQMVITLNHDSVRLDTASVRENQTIAFGNLPEVSVRGLLRSEVRQKLQDHIDLYLRGATVRVNFLMRIAILGQVRAPNYYSLAPDRPVSELFVAAGGPSPFAKLDAVEVKRDGELLIDSERWTRAVKEGTTLQQLGLRPGDELHVPARRGISWTAVLRGLLVITSLALAILNILRWYYSTQE